MMAMVIFMGMCMLGMLVLLRFLFAWFQEPAASGNYLVKIGERRRDPPSCTRPLLRPPAAPQCMRREWRAA